MARFLFPNGERPPHTLVPGKQVVGRIIDCDIVLGVADVSREHAAVWLEDDGAVYVQDLGSRNGTHVNGKPTTGKVRLSIGDEVRFGIIDALFEDDVPQSARLAVVTAPPASSSPPPPQAAPVLASAPAPVASAAAASASPAAPATSAPPADPQGKRASGEPRTAPAPRSAARRRMLSASPSTVGPALLAAVGLGLGVVAFMRQQSSESEIAQAARRPRPQAVAPAPAAIAPPAPVAAPAKAPPVAPVEAPDPVVALVPSYRSGASHRAADGLPGGSGTAPGGRYDPLSNMNQGDDDGSVVGGPPVRPPARTPPATPPANPPAKPVVEPPPHDDGDHDHDLHREPPPAQPTPTVRVDEPAAPAAPDADPDDNADALTKAAREVGDLVKLAQAGDPAAKETMKKTRYIALRHEGSLAPALAARVMKALRDRLSAGQAVRFVPRETLDVVRGAPGKPHADEIEVRTSYTQDYMKGLGRLVGKSRLGPHPKAIKVEVVAILAEQSTKTVTTLNATTPTSLDKQAEAVPGGLRDQAIWDATMEALEKSLSTWSGRL